MLLLETSIQLSSNVRIAAEGINALVAGLPDVGRELARHIGVQVLVQAQDAHLQSVREGRAELVCSRCGVVHCGPASNLVRRGQRMRTLRASIGTLRFPLRQVTCRDCGRTWSPYPEMLGLLPRQRISEELERKLVEAVTSQSYAKTCELAEAWLGGSVSPRTLHGRVQARGANLVFTPAPACKVAMADGTKVPAAKSRYGTDVRVCFQILGRGMKNGRSVVHKRIAGWSIGPVGWSAALPAGVASETIVTDREAGIPQVLAKQHPGVRHQLCEWHLGHSINHLMALDKVPVAERKRRVRELNRILWEPGERRRERYEQFWRTALSKSRRARAMLRDSQDRILYATPSGERTTSPAEREMREINRRTNVGALWSVPGVDHMLRLRHALRLNPDDFERVWSAPTRPMRFQVVPLA